MQSLAQELVCNKYQHLPDPQSLDSDSFQQKMDRQLVTVIFT